MKNLKNILFTVLLAFLFIEVLIIFPQRLEHKEDTAPAPLPTPADSAQPEQKVQGMHLVESQQGSRDWELFSEMAEGSQGKGAWELKNIKVLFYNNEKVSFTVTGKTGTIDGKSKDLRIKGDVVTKSANGYIFKTPSVLYRSKQRQIQSPEKVFMVGPKDEMGEGFELEGRNMLVKVDDSQMTVNQDIRGSKKFKDGKTFVVKSDRAEFSGKSHQAKFLGNVDIRYADLRLQGPAAIFQYKGNTDLINYIQMQGGVRVHDEDKLATAEIVNLDLLKNIFTFRGNPKVIQNSDELSGEEIIFLDGGKKVKVEKIRARMEKKE